MKRTLFIAGFILWSCNINVRVDRSCPAGTSRCSDRCSDTSIDLENCGQCGNRCPKGQVCSNGTCGNFCFSGTTLCTDHCAKLGSDPSNCGACGNVCKLDHAAATCTNGACTPVCLTTYADCDANAANGCETDLATSTTSCGKCGRDCLGGDCVKGICQAALLSPGAAAAVVADESNIYWEGGYEIRACSKASCIPTVLGSRDFGGLAIDSANVYWTTEQAVFKCAKSGCPSPTMLAMSQGQPGGTATDGVNVYWVAHTPMGHIWKCAINGCGGVPTELTPYSFAPSGYGSAIATDGTNVFFTTYRTTEICPVSGCMTPAKFASETGNVLALDDTNLYIGVTIGFKPRLTKCALAGCNEVAKTVAPGGVGGITTLGKEVYWTRTEAGTVQKCAIDNCVPEVLASAQANLGGIAVDEKAIYFGSSKGLMRLAK